MLVTTVLPARNPAASRPIGRSWAGSLLRVALATAMLVPVLLFALLLLVVQIAASGRLLDLLGRLVVALPDDPSLGTVLMVGSVLGGPILLAIACITVPRLFAILLLVVGGAAETYVALLTGLADGALWVLGLGAGGLLLAAVQVRTRRGA